MVVADGELREYRQKVAGLEGSLAGKDEELKKQAAALTQKEAAAQRFSEARSKAEDRAKQLAKKLQSLEATASCELPPSRLLYLWVASAFYLT